MEIKYIQISKEKKYQKKMHHASVSLMMLGSAIRVNKKYYPQILFEEYKYTIKKKRKENGEYY